MKNRLTRGRRSATGILCSLMSLLFLFSGASHAQKVDIRSSPNPVGSGARALGMGGAFIAVADDATGASWNPAGLVQLDFPEISAVWAGFQRTEDNRSGVHPGIDGEESVSDLPLNYLSFAYPFNLFGRNMIVSLNHQHLYDFSRDWDFSYPLETSDPSKSEEMFVDYRQDGRLTALGIALGTQFTETLSLGITLNLWNDSLGKNEWTENSLVSHSDHSSEYVRRASDRYVFEGVNANIGLMYQTLDQRISIGAVFKTPFRADVEHWSWSRTSVRYPEGNQEEPDSRKKTDEKLDMPMSYGVGFAYRFSDELTVAADVYRTEWDDFVLDDGDGEKSAVTGKPADQSDIDPTHQVRVGAEYLYIGESHVFPIRGGVFYDPAPAEGSPDDFWGFSVGTGVMWDKLFQGSKCSLTPKTVIFDIACQYRFGNDVGGHLIDGWNFSQDVREYTVYSSVIVHF